MFSLVVRDLICCRRSLTTSAISLASGKEHRRRKQAHKHREDKEWEAQRRMNPFTRNIGAARQLRILDVDVDDPTFKTEDINEVVGDMDVTLEEKRDRSKAFRTLYKADEEHLQHLAKRKMIQKKMFPKPPNPNLLTWMEKEMIRYLHKKDPVEWSKQRLADSFPATPGVIHQVLKARTCYEKEVIEKYNKEVVQNWKLLSKGQLELEPRYEEHLREGNRSIGVSSGEKHLAEQEIKVNFEKHSIGLPKPVIPGEFASIIVNYNKKLARDKQEEADLQTQEVFQVHSLFGDNTIPGTPMENEVSVYTDTALLATNIDLSREKHMDIIKFRNKYLKKDIKQEEELNDPNPYRKKYLEWVKKEEEKSKFAAKTVEKIDATQLSIISKDTQLLYETAESEQIDVQVSETGQTFVFNPEAGYKQPYVKPNNPDAIEIPEEIKNKYKFYQLGDSFYDVNGEFLYRIPGLD